MAVMTGAVAFEIKVFHLCVSKGVFNVKLKNMLHIYIALIVDWYQSGTKRVVNLIDPPPFIIYLLVTEK